MAFLIVLIGAGATTTAVYAQTEDTIVATVNGRNITQREVDASVISQLFPLQQQLYALRKTALQNLILKTILTDEAKKRSLSVEELRHQLTVGKVEILQGQVEQLYLDNASAFAAMSPDEAKERLRLDLESQARMKNYREALSKLKERARINVRLEEPRLPFVNNSDTASSIGSKEAAITITEFSDFECPYCKQAQSTVKRVLQSYGNNIKLVFKHLPLEIHPQAFLSARAAYCAGNQGFFWKYQDALFASESLSPEIFDKIASQLGLDISKFKTCVSSETSRAAVLKDVQEARQLGINGTPTFIINGKTVQGAPAFEEFKDIIEHELKLAQPTSGQK